MRQLTEDEKRIVAGGNQPSEKGTGCLGPSGPKTGKK